MLNKNNIFMANCAGCKNPGCSKVKNCTRGQDFSSYLDTSKKEYEKTVNKKILEVSARIEGEHYMEWTRLEEIISSLTHCKCLIKYPFFKRNTPFSRKYCS